jgi:hypothetical protein
MYSWDKAAHSSHSGSHSGDEHAEAPPATQPTGAVQAVQVALDRRDNGGESGR